MAITNLPQAIFSILSNTSGVSSIISKRIYPEVLPQNVQYPCVLFFALNSTVDNHLQGDSGLRRSRVQVESWAQTFSAAVALSAAVSTALKNYSGTVDSFVIGATLQLSENPLYEPDLQVFRIIQDYHVWHNV